MEKLSVIEELKSVFGAGCQQLLSDNQAKKKVANMRSLRRIEFRRKRIAEKVDYLKLQAKR